MMLSWPLEPSPAIRFVLLFVVGLCVGSFLNVVIIRLPRGRSLLKPSSRCGFCRSSIPTWMNIPVLSFLFSGGTCARCGTAFSARYPAIELLTAILFSAVGAVYGWSVQTLFFCLFSASLIAMTFIDLELRIIPDQISLGGWLVALLLSALNIPGYPIDFFSALMGSISGYLTFWLVSRAFLAVTQEEGLGGGDVKLMGFIGAVFGWKGVLTTILVGNILGALVGVISILIYKKSKRSPIPFGPFLAIGALVHLFQLDLMWWI
ncbi:MAG: peptidase [Bacteriovoracaceae bacterium]|nr:peptidase [Bacteriovoracaceae bacterium]